MVYDLVSMGMSSQGVPNKVMPRELLITPSLSTGPLSAPSCNSFPVTPKGLGISFPDGNVTRSGRIGFVLGVWLPSCGIYTFSNLVPSLPWDVTYIILIRKMLGRAQHNFSFLIPISRSCSHPVSRSLLFRIQLPHFVC